MNDPMPLKGFTAYDLTRYAEMIARVVDDRHPERPDVAIMRRLAEKGTTPVAMIRIELVGRRPLIVTVEEAP